ncbi:hypothetical protein SNE40_017733 [Patella caerulea]|uniref:Uncharacterized protein n=1 Tax=Patella caerulea TaxID=87958 RepID=A0AAN8PA90_PATCE
MKLFVLFLSAAAVLAVSSATAIQTTTEEPVEVTTLSQQNVESSKFDGIDLDLLTQDELEALMEAEDEKFTGELDIYLGANAINKRSRDDSKVARPKRWVPLAIAGGRIAFAAGRAFLSRYARNGITRSGARITKHYSRPGNYFTGLREFKKLNPTGVKRIGGSKFNGWTGTSGNYRVTVRSGSKGTTGANGSPTLSISSKGGDLVRKFRFD